MWSAEVNNRELFEFYLGATKVVESRVRETGQLRLDSGNGVLLVWDVDPSVRFSLPSLVVVPGENEMREILSAIAAAPQAPSPISALSRVITRAEARHNFDEEVLHLEEGVFPALTALTFIEAVLHGDGKLGLRQLTPLICKRTLSFAWGRALAGRVRPDSFMDLPGRWLEMYSRLNEAALADAAQRTVDSMLRALNLVGQLALGRCPDKAPGALAFELLSGSKTAQENAWRRLSQFQTRLISLDELQTLAREERASYLQDALRSLGSPESRDPANADVRDELAAACAFLATRLAPGSLEHLDVLKSSGQGDVLAWYGLYAALQSPKEMMSLVGGLGYRVLRDLERVEEKLASPVSDIAYSEFIVLARGGLENLSGRLGHASELQVEVVPFVCTSFTFHPRRSARSADSQQALALDRPERSASPRARLAQLAKELADLASDLPEGSENGQLKRNRRR